MAEDTPKMSTSTARVQVESKMFSAAAEALGKIEPPSINKLTPPLSRLITSGTPENNPFSSLPWPSPGDRIKSEDFKTLSQSLQIIHDVFSVSATFFGRTFGEVKLALATQQFQIQRVMSVFGSEIENINDPSLDSRKVIQVMPTALGDHQLLIVVTEAIDTRRFAPNLIGLTYREAAELIRARLGDVTFTGTPPTAQQFVGCSLGELQQSITKK
jgi:hypothetical protein